LSSLPYAERARRPGLDPFPVKTEKNRLDWLKFNTEFAPFRVET
jgi:hypothetical protein